MTRVSVEVKNGDINRALQIFKSKVKEAGIIHQATENKYYTKKSKQRRIDRYKAEMREKKRAKNYCYPGKNFYRD